MRFLVKAIAVLILLGGIGLVGFAYVGDLSPVRHDLRVPVTLNVD